MPDTPLLREAAERALEALEETRFVREEYQDLEKISRAIEGLRSALAQKEDAAILADRKERDGWRPIATAPKDGTEVLLAAQPQGRVTYGYWHAPADKPRIVYRDGFAPEEEWEDFEPYWASWDGGFTAEYPPTHWKPLPEGPDASIDRAMGDGNG